MQTQNVPPLSPMRIFEALNAYQKTAALKAAIDLDIFTHIAKGATTTKQIAARTHASEKGTRILCDYMVLQGFLTKDGNSYGLAPDADFFLNRRSPAYIGSATQFLCSPDLRKHYDDLSAAVRKGGTTAEDEGTVEPENPIWVEFARGMAGLMTFLADGTRTLPMRRGTWILRELFNDPPNTPPPNAGEIQPNTSGKNLTVRQRLELHRRDDICASCHAKLDPYGLALENYDAIGQWRERFNGEGFRGSNGPVLDVSGQLHDGTRFATLEEYKAGLMKDRKSVV